MTSLRSQMRHSSGRSFVRVQSYAKLDNAAEVIKKLNSTVKFYVIGGTDTRASDSYNFDLSERRAKAVVKYLILSGFDVRNITAIGYGETFPAQLNDTEWGRKLNRRVEFRFTR